MITRLIIFLIRRKLGLAKYEEFRFNNQRSKRDKYYFDSTHLMKIEYAGKEDFNICESNVSLNWLLNDGCSIVRVDKS